jgi:hypothetical protein
MRYSRLPGESDSLYQMRWIPIVLIGVHGLIHLMGFAKGSPTPSFLNSPSQSGDHGA